MRRYGVSLVCSLLCFSTYTRIVSQCIYRDKVFILPVTREVLQVWSDPNRLCFRVLKVEIQREKERERGSVSLRMCVCVCVCVSAWLYSFISSRAFRKMFKCLLLEICEICEWFIGKQLQKYCIKGLWDWSPHYHTNGLSLLSWFPLELWELRQWCYVSLVSYFLETSVILMYVFVLCIYLLIVCTKKTLRAFATVQFGIMGLHISCLKRWNMKTFYIFTSKYFVWVWNLMFVPKGSR
jgi:hypothetical protein